MVVGRCWGVPGLRVKCFCFGAWGLGRGLAESSGEPESSKRQASARRNGVTAHGMQVDGAS